MDLIRQLNETTSQRDAEDELFESNCTAAAKHAKVSAIELTESIINWLGDIGEKAKAGELSQPQTDNTAALADRVDKMRGTAEVMGAVLALTDPDIAEAMNVKNPRALLNVASSRDPQSDKAIEYLKGLGRGEAKVQTRQIQELLKSGDDQNILNAIVGLQNKAKKLLLIQQPPQEPAAKSAPGRLGLAGAMEKEPQI